MQTNLTQKDQELIERFKIDYSNGNNFFHQLILEKDIETINYILDNLLIKEINGSCESLQVTYKGELAYTSNLIALRNDDGKTPIDLAVEGLDDLNTVKNIMSKEFYHSFDTAVKYGRIDLLKYLAEERGVEMYPNYIKNSFKIALKNNYTEVLDYIAENLKLYDNAWDRPLITEMIHTCFDFGHMKLIASFSKVGDSINSLDPEDKSMLYKAICLGDEEKIKFLMNLGAKQIGSSTFKLPTEALRFLAKIPYGYKTFNASNSMTNPKLYFSTFEEMASPFFMLLNHVDKNTLKSMDLLHFAGSLGIISTELAGKEYEKEALVGLLKLSFMIDQETFKNRTGEFYQEGHDAVFKILSEQFNAKPTESTQKVIDFFLEQLNDYTCNGNLLENLKYKIEILKFLEQFAQYCKSHAIQVDEQMTATKQNFIDNVISHIQKCNEYFSQKELNLANTVKDYVDIKNICDLNNFKEEINWLQKYLEQSKVAHDISQPSKHSVTRISKWLTSYQGESISVYLEKLAEKGLKIEPDSELCKIVAKLSSLNNEILREFVDEKYLPEIMELELPLIGIKLDALQHETPET